MVTPGFAEVASTYHVSFDEMSVALVDVWTLATGFFTFFTTAAATLWSKRPLFITSMAILLTTSVWGVLCKEFCVFRCDAWNLRSC
ncbi:hypothetical protein ACMFMG_001976 [Clarireedia jacksonii]